MSVYDGQAAVREAERGWEEADGTWLLSGAPNRAHADAWAARLRQVPPVTAAGYCEGSTQKGIFCEEYANGSGTAGIRPSS